MKEELTEEQQEFNDSHEKDKKNNKRKNKNNNKKSENKKRKQHIDHQIGNTNNENRNGNAATSNAATSNAATSNAENLIEIAESNVKQFFKDQYGTAFAAAMVNDHNEILSIDSSKFRRYLTKLFYDNNNRKIVSTEAINNAVNLLQAKAEYDSPTFPLSLRVTWSKDKKEIYYDLSDEKWRVINITKDGWQVVDNPPVLFTRYNQIPQVEPKRNYKPDIFDKFIALTNLKGEGSKLLLKIYIVSLFIPDIPHPILLPHGEQGSAKSTDQTLIKLLVDPSKPTLLTVHNDRNEFIQQLAHNHVAYYDNIKRVPDWLSDEACKAVTGIGQTKRRLYSNDEDFIYEYKRCLAFNGINISLIEPDAIDRSILIELERITRENRKLESEIFAEFKELRPGLLGYIFDILIKTLQIFETIKLDDLPRMADFALWGEAISRAMNHKPLEFINAYYDNIGKQNIEAVEAHPLGLAVTKFWDEVVEESKLDAKKSAEYYDSTSECLNMLNDVAGKNNININSKSWPKSAASLSRSLNRIRSSLLEGFGIEISIGRVTTDDSKYKKNTSTIRIRKIPPPSPPSPPVENQTQI